MPAPVNLPVHVVLQAIDRASPTIGKTSTALSALGHRVQAVGRQLTYGLTLPLVSVATGVLRTAISFREKMNEVRAVSKEAGISFEELESEARRLGETTQFSATEAAAGMAFLGRAGFDTGKIFQSTKHFLDLAAASGIDLARAADIGSNVMQAFGYQAERAQDVVDVLALTTARSNTNLEQLAEAFQKWGPVAEAAGIDIREAAAAVGVLGNAGIQGSLAGNALARAVVALINPTAEATAALKSLGINRSDLIDAEGRITDFTAVIEAFEFALSGGNREVGELREQLEEMRSRGLTGEEIEAEMRKLGATTAGLREIMTIFGLRAGPAMAAAIGQGREALVNLRDELREVGGAARMSETMMEGLPGELKRLKSAVQEAALQIADQGGLSGDIGSLAERIRRLTLSFNSLSPETKRAIVQWGEFGAVLGPVTLGLGLAVSLLGKLNPVAFAASVAIAAVVTQWDRIVAVIETFKVGILEVSSFLGVPIDQGMLHEHRLDMIEAHHRARGRPSADIRRRASEIMPRELRDLPWARQYFENKIILELRGQTDAVNSVRTEGDVPVETHLGPSMGVAR